MVEEHGDDNKFLAVDKIILHAIWVFEGHNSEIMEGEEVIEKSRSIKGPDEILVSGPDQVGFYDIFVDISLTLWVGNKKPQLDMVCAKQHIYKDITTNMEMPKSGVHISDLSRNTNLLDDQYQKG